MSTTLAAGLAPLGGIEEVRIDWRWTPASAARRHDQ